MCSACCWRRLNRFTFSLLEKDVLLILILLFLFLFLVLFLVLFLALLALVLLCLCGEVSLVFLVCV